MVAGINVGDGCALRLKPDENCRHDGKSYQEERDNSACSYRSLAADELHSLLLPLASLLLPSG
jgi:hypothetical protein